jgi:2-polyprenyl-6-methoxyphenol hydroxylase-like FAD-dependent oxidoreductase
VRPWAPSCSLELWANVFTPPIRSSDRDYGNWSKKARFSAPLLFSTSRWLTENNTAIHGTNTSNTLLQKTDMQRETTFKTNFPGKRAIVVGAGIGGLSVSRVLADYFDEVLILERDELPDEATPRPGVPQGKQPHGLLAGGLKALEKLFPGFGEELRRAGAEPMQPGSDILFEIPGQPLWPRMKFSWQTYSMSRPMIELILRRKVQCIRNILIRSGWRARKILSDSNVRAATGISYQTDDGNLKTLDADLIVDASGNASLTVEFLKATARRLPAETRIGVSTRYAGALFERTRIWNHYKGVLTFPNAPKECRGGIILPAENNRNQVILIGRGNDIPAIDGDGFLSYARGLPTPTVYNTIRNAKRLSEIAPFSFPESRWRHFAQVPDFPIGLLPIGDTICRFNPVYGQGMTVALQEAHLLLELLRTSDRNPLPTLASNFLSKAETLISDPWAMSAVPDFIYADTTGERPSNLEDHLNFQRALGRLAARDAGIYELLTEVRHMLKPLSLLDDPWIARRVEKEMAECTG